MITFNWDEYKQFREHSYETDKLKIAIDFMRSFYNASSAQEMFEMLKRDDVGEMMLEKRDINSPSAFEQFMYE